LSDRVLGSDLVAATDTAREVAHRAVR